MTVRDLIDGYYDHCFTDFEVYNTNMVESETPIWEWDSKTDGRDWYCGIIEVKIPNEIGKMKVKNWAFLGTKELHTEIPPCIYIEVEV